MEGGSPKMIRKPLRVNNRWGIKQEFATGSKLGGTAPPSILTWASPAKGTKGETVNATNNASKQIVNRNWKPIQS